jgi:hypothetical protein
MSDIGDNDNEDWIVVNKTKETQAPFSLSLQNWKYLISKYKEICEHDNILADTILRS